MIYVQKDKIRKTNIRLLHASHCAGSKRIVVKRVIVPFGEMWNYYSCFFFSRTAIKRPVMCRFRRDYVSR